MTPIRRSLQALALVATTLPALAQDKKELVIGATAGSNIEVLRLGIKPLLEKKGYKVKLVEFNDYVQPNLALDQGALDANFFQHITYLNRFREDRKLDLVDIVQGPMAPFGIYSKKRKSIADVKPGDRITLANDPANLAHGLALLADQKLLTLKAGADPIRVTEKDVASNPLNLKLQPLLDTHAGRTALASFSSADPTKRWTVREAAEFIGLGGRGPVLVGDPAQIADQLIAWQDASGIDGFNLTYAVAHENLRDVVDLVVPELQRRGRYRLDYEAGTYRHKLFGHGARLNERHAGRKVRLDTPHPLEKAA